MKKTFILLTTIFVACFLQSAQLDWGISGPQSLAGSSVYLIEVASFPTSITSFNDFAKKDVATGSSTLQDKGSYSETPTNEAILTPASYNFYIVITQTLAGINYYWRSGSQEVPVTITQKADLVLNPNGELDTTLGDISNWTQITADVPEPTTLALLALGIAALGLKRKV